MTDTREMFRRCACCPNQCRVAMDASEPVQAESLTPSALSLVAFAVIEGQLPNDADTRRALARTGPARPCAALCPYGYDIAAAIDQFAARLCRVAGQNAPPG